MANPFDDNDSAYGCGTRRPGARTVFSATRASKEPPPAGPEQVRDHHGDLHQKVLEDLLGPILPADLILGQPGLGAGQCPQVPGLHIPGR
jgi:hypothetical protein